jgi:hypothetical protein
MCPIQDTYGIQLKIDLHLSFKHFIQPFIMIFLCFTPNEEIFKVDLATTKVSKPLQHQLLIIFQRWENTEREKKITILTKWSSEGRKKTGYFRERNLQKADVASIMENNFPFPIQANNSCAVGTG